MLVFQGTTTTTPCKRIYILYDHIV